MAASILLVDDEIAVTSSLKTVLESEGYAVVIASSTPEAAAALHKDKFDLILTDLKMETETAGYEVVREARCQPYDPMVLILTAFPIAGREWRKAGAHAMVTKPVPMQQLLRTIERLMAARRARHDNGLGKRVLPSMPRGLEFRWSSLKPPHNRPGPTAHRLWHLSAQY